MKFRQGNLVGKTGQRILLGNGQEVEVRYDGNILYIGSSNLNLNRDKITAQVNGIEVLSIDGTGTPGKTGELVLKTGLGETIIDADWGDFNPNRYLRFGWLNPSGSSYSDGPHQFLIGDNGEVSYYTSRSGSSVQQLRFRQNDQRIGNPSNSTIYLDSANQTVLISMMDDDSGYGEYFRMDGVNRQIYLGHHGLGGTPAGIYLTIGTGSSPIVRVMSGTDTWLYINADTQRLGNTTNAAIQVAAGLNDIYMYGVPADTGVRTQLFDLDSSENILYIGNQTDLHLRVGIGSSPSVRVMSGTDEWLTVSSSFQSIGGGGHRINIIPSLYIRMYGTPSDTGSETQLFDLDGPNNLMYLGNQADLHLRVGIGSSPSVRVMSGTDEWLNINASLQTIGNISDTGLRFNQSSNAIHMYSGSNQIMEALPTDLRFGIAGGTYFFVDNFNDRFRFLVNAQDMIWVSSNLLLLGPNNNTVITDTGFYADQSNNEIRLYIGGSYVLDILSSGTRFGNTGARITQIDDDTTLSADSSTRGITQHAAKTYTDTLVAALSAAIGFETYSGVVTLTNGAVSASILYDQPQVDSVYALTTQLRNEVDSPPSIYSHIITSKTKFGFDVRFSGLIDSINYKLDFILSRNQSTSSSSSSISSSSKSSSSSSTDPTLHMFYSVGTETGTLYSGNASAINGVLTLVSPASNNIGVGDEVRVGSNRYYINGRNSSTEFTIQNSSANGGTPGDTNITFGSQSISIYRAFNTLSSAESGARDSNHLNTGNLAINLFQLNFACYADGEMSNNSQFSNTNWTTDPYRYIKVYTPTLTSEVGTSQRHNGTWGTGFRINTNASPNHLLRIAVDYIWIEGLAIQAAINSAGIMVNNSYGTFGVSNLVKISHNVIKGQGSGGSDRTRGVYMYDSNSRLNIDLWNNMAYAHAGWQGFYFQQVNVANSYNNTSYKNYSATSQGEGFRRITGTVVLINCISMDNNYDFYGGGWDASSDYNMASDTTAPGGNSLQSKVASNQFVSITGGSENLHLKTGADAIDNGTDLSGIFNDDIDGDIRTGNWDIGADQF